MINIEKLTLVLHGNSRKAAEAALKERETHRCEKGT